MNATTHKKITKGQFQHLAEELLLALDTRAKDVIERRFGLKTGSKETLESIGQEYGITRERVRQIEAQAKKGVATRLNVLEPVDVFLREVFQKEGGILAEERVVEQVSKALNDALPTALIHFYLEILPAYDFTNTDANFAPHWRYPAAVPPEAEIVARTAHTILQKGQHPLAEPDFLAAIRAEVGSIISQPFIYAWLLASKHARKNVFGQWGLAAWAEITPRGVGDKAYAVLRRHGKPEHFRQIARLINEAAFDRKVANPQTVHNELIKDNRFVLVGRGLYGLTEWGFMPGTVADVLETILGKAAQPMTREELIEQVLAQRLVKKNTILLSLQDQNRFVKTAGNRYTLREKP